MAIRVCIAGASGWTGSAVTKAVLSAPDLTLVGAVARRSAGQDVGVVLGRAEAGVRVSETVEQALEADTDVLVDYTHPEAVKGHVMSALGSGVSCVIGTSGLTAVDYEELERRARSASVGVVAAGNFSLTAALAKHFSGIAARFVPHWEVIDYAHGGKPDAPSGTTQELAEFLGSVASQESLYPIDEVHGPREARGTTIGGAQVHSIRLPGYTVSFEAVFGLPGERLSIRHDSGSDAQPYVHGTLLAIRKATSTVGLVRGLDTLLFGLG